MTLLNSSKWSCGTFSEIKPTIAALLKECGRTKEHQRQFDLENVSASKINKAFHIDVNNIRTLSKDISCLDTETDVQITCWYCKGRSEQDSADQALLEGEGLMAFLCNPDNKSKLGCIHFLEFQGMSIAPFSNSNDNIVTLTLDFTARVFIDVQTQI